MAIFDSSGEKVLLTQRSDNGLWCLPGGGVDIGETVVQAVMRETNEETGFTVRVNKLIGVYSSPGKLVLYPDGNTFQVVAIHFIGMVIDKGNPDFECNEVIAKDYFSREDLISIDLFEFHRERIMDSFEFGGEIFLK